MYAASDSRSSVNKRMAVCLMNRPLKAIHTVILPLRPGAIPDNVGDVWGTSRMSKRNRNLITAKCLLR